MYNNNIEQICEGAFASCLPHQYKTVVSTCSIESAITALWLTGTDRPVSLGGSVVCHEQPRAVSQSVQCAPVDCCAGWLPSIGVELNAHYSTVQMFGSSLPIQLTDREDDGVAMPTISLSLCSSTMVDYGEYEKTTTTKVTSQTYVLKGWSDGSSACCRIGWLAKIRRK